MDRSDEQTTPHVPAKVWQPSTFTLGAQGDHDIPVAVCILNQPIVNRELLLKVSEKAAYVICADGGANRLKELDLSESEESRCRVTAVCGDFDSVKPEVLAYYEKKGATIYHDPDQYSTDLMKCLKYLKQQPFDTSIDVALLGSLGGRADQAFSLLHQLFLNESSLSNYGIRDLYLMIDNGILFLLEQGTNCIPSPVHPGYFTPNIGIIPVAKPSVITTRGLEWDVENWPTEFGGQMSTSNHIITETVEVMTTERVLFTMEFDFSAYDG